MRTIKKLSLLGFLVICLAGCNTVHGVGQDIQSAGHHISNAAS